MFFKKVGDFFTKTVPKTVTKDIPRIVTKDIPRIVTKDIPRVVTKDIPNAIAGVGQRETYRPELVALRGRVERAEKLLAERRDAFFVLKAEYAEQRKEYQRLSEDYARRRSDVAAQLEVAYIPDREWNDPVAGENEVLRHVEGSFRNIVGFLTLGLGEAAWAAPEAAREEEFLQQRLATLQAVNMKLGRALDELSAAKQTMRETCDQIRQTIGGGDAELAGERLNEQALAAGVDAGRREIALAMFAAGASPEQVALVTELDIVELQRLQAAGTPAAAGNAVAMSDGERHENAAQLLREGLEVAQVARLTGLTAEQITAPDRA